MTTIPASQIVDVIPGVLSAGGAALVMNGLILTENTRVPIGQVLSFPNDGESVSNYFGPTSAEAALATVYFNSFDTSSLKPQSILFTQYPATAVSAYLRGGNVSGFTVPQLAALSGSLRILIDGYVHSNTSISLAGATSFSAAAALIQSALNTSLPTEATVTASIGGTFGTSSTSGTVLTLGSVTTGSLWPGDVVSGTDSTNSLPAGCTIVNQLTGTAGGSAGATFTISAAATPGNMTSATVTSLSTTVDVTAVASGTVSIGQNLVGASVPAGTLITGLLTGSGLTGTYAISGSGHTIASESMTLKAVALAVSFDSVSGGFIVESGITGTPSTAAFAQSIDGSATACTTSGLILTVGGTVTGTFNIGDTVSGTDSTNSLPTACTIVNQLTGSTGVAGTYTLSAAASPGNLSSCAVTAWGNGGLAASLDLTQSTGAVLSQGAAATTPAAFMTSVTQLTQNWATFMTLFDPDNANWTGAFTQKLAFATWVNGTQDRYAYVCKSNDIVATEQVPATASFGYALQQGDYSGTFPVYDPLNEYIDAFVCGIAAAINFQATNGRITFAFRGQTGLVGGVTTATAADNLGGNPQQAGNYGNGYNYYGAYAEANQNFIFLNRGTISGPFLWMDSYINQIWLNSQLRLSILTLMTQVNSIPYNAAGYALIAAACQDPINQALNFGAIRAGVTLSQSQIAQINNTAGVSIASIVQQRGWYLQIKDAAPQVRQGRASPPCMLWYTDGQSIQAITLNSIEVQ